MAKTHAQKAAACRPDTLRVLLALPDAERPGGVVQYFRALRPHFKYLVRFFTIGSRSDREGPFVVLARVICDSWRFSQTLRAEHFDLVHLNPSIGAKALLRDGMLVLIAKLWRKPVVVFTHGWDTTCERLLLKYFSALFRATYGQSDAIVVLGSQFEKNLRALGYRGTVFVHGAPIDDDLWQDSRRTPSQSYEGARFNVLFLARLEKEKGIYEALETYQLLKQQFPFVSLTIAGDGSERPRAAQYVAQRRLRDVGFAGLVRGERKYEIYRNANAYLFPSYSEGLPISVLEAIAYGLPIVTSGVGALPDFFQEGEMGFMTPGRQPAVLAELLGRLVREPLLCRKIRHFNRQYAENRFGASHIASGLERIYRLTVEGSRKRRSQLDLVAEKYEYDPQSEGDHA